MDSVNLNIDVLHLILGRSDRNTVSQIMKTCRFLNLEGVKYLLSRGPAITNEARATSFVQFALPTRPSADVAHRLHWIKSLHALVLDEEETEVVAQVLKPFFTLVGPRAPNFSVLEIDLAERFFGAAPELYAPIASLTTLRVLSVFEAVAQTVMMLRALQSPLTKVECLRATESRFRFRMDPDVPWQRQRDLNVTEQAREGSWSGLTSYKGSIFMLHVLGFACPVTDVDVHDHEQEGIMKPWQIQVVLRDTHPLHFTIRIRRVEDFLMQAHEFIELSRSREFQRLQSLRLELNFWRGSWDADLEGIMLCLNLIYDAMIAPSPIPSVTLVINITSATTKSTYMQYLGIRRPPLNEPPTPSPVKLYLDSLDPDTVADPLFTRNSSRCAVKVVFTQNWEKQAIVNRGHPRSTIELDFDRYF